MYITYYFFVLFVAPKTSSVHVCISLTDHGWIVYNQEVSSFSLCPISSHPTPALLYITSCISTSQGLCCHSRPVFLHITSWCYGCLHLVPHRITACSCRLCKLWLIITQKDKWKQSKSDVGTQSNREIAVTAKRSETKLRRVRKSSKQTWQGSVLKTPNCRTAFKRSSFPCSSPRFFREAYLCLWDCSHHRTLYAFLVNPKKTLSKVHGSTLRADLDSGGTQRCHVILLHQHKQEEPVHSAIDWLGTE